MKNVRVINFVLLMIWSMMLSAQDIHFTQFELAPQALNPALNGSFLGTFRVSALSRDQFQNTGVNGYRTIEAGVDAPIIRGLRKQDWIGVGVSFNRDVRGLFDFSDTHTRMGLTYHLSIDKKQMQVISIGVQRVSVNRTINIPTGADITSYLIQGIGRTDPDVERLRQAASSGQGGGGGSANQMVERSFGDWVGGIALTTKTKTSKFVAGVSATHFINNNSALLNTFDLPFRLTAFSTYEGLLNKNMSIEPSIIVQSMGTAVEVSAHALTGYKIKPDNPLIVKGGLGIRTGTLSAQLLAGADYKSIRAGFAYDLPVSGYSGAPGIQNAIEFGVTYIGTINKKPKLKPIVICPRL